MSYLDTLFGEDDSGDVADRAREAYSEQAEKALAELRTAERTGRGDIGQAYQRLLDIEQPYLGAGKEAMESYLGTLGIGDRQGAINRFKAAPGYRFALEQGQRALERQGAARGLTGSGAQQKELMRFGQGLANQQYGAYQNRLANLAKLGAATGQFVGGQAQTTGARLADLGRLYSGGRAGIYGAMGTSAANAILAQAAMRARQHAGFMRTLGELGGAALGGPFGEALGGAVFGGEGNTNYAPVEEATPAWRGIPYRYPG